ncbi:MAG: S1 RNA-binding domain-containing protein, partial [Pygmaiobacter sp.]
MAVEVGSILEGKVTGVKNFGAFVELPGGGTGMVHISEVSNEYIQQLTDVLHEGQQVKVKVMSVSPDGKVALSIKRTEPKPRPTRADPGRTWQPKSAPVQNDLGFEDLM